MKKTIFTLLLLYVFGFNHLNAQAKAFFQFSENYKRPIDGDTVTIIFEKAIISKNSKTIRLSKAKAPSRSIVQQLRRAKINPKKLQEIVDKSKDDVIYVTKSRTYKSKGQIPIIVAKHPDGAEIIKILESSDTYISGLRDGDVITSFNNRLIADAEDYFIEITHLANDEEIDLTYLRDGRSQNLSILAEPINYLIHDQGFEKIKHVKYSRISK